MPLATSNRAQLRYILESTFGTIPVAGNPNNLRMTGESLAYAIDTATSQEIRADRQKTDLVPVGANANGGINFELSYREFDTLLQAVMQGTWADFGTLGVGAVIPTSATFAASTLTAGAATSGTSIFTNLQKGQWVGISGSSNPAHNIWVQVSRTVAPTATVLTFEGTPFTSATGSGGAAVKISTSHLVNGTTERSFTIERALNDVNQFFAYRGMSANKLSMSFQSGSIVTGSLDFMGKDSVRNAATALPGTPVASQTYDVANAVSGVGNILENGAALAGTFIKSLKFDLNNNLRARDAIGVLGAASIGSGSAEITGEIEVYLNDGSLYDKFVNNTATSITWSCKDGAGNGYVFQFPKVKYSDAKVQAGGLDQDVMLTLPFTAVMDTVSGNTFIINRIGA